MTASASVIACGLDGPLVVPDPSCPHGVLHEPAPQTYTAWHDWAGRQVRAGRVQSRCPGCGLYRVWSSTPTGATS